ncbi:MAG: hypothetical protein GX591_05700, partial [Planctomycetes bacterium]|nr:hypothetical protein [Planctomycetota bacterium]
MLRSVRWVGVLAVLACALGVKAEFLVNTSTDGDQRDPAVAMTGDGAFVVVWRGLDGDSGGIRARSFLSEDVPLGSEYTVNSAASGSQSNPCVAMDAAGNYAVAWTTPGSDGYEDVVFRRMSLSGIPLSVESRVNGYVTNRQIRPAIGMGSSDEFTIVWESN